ncbi:LON peptidase substrate-binding domain-containing protein [Acidisoma sp. C75]
MRPFHPAPGQLPRQIPVFPLPGALLLPGGRLPLNIFEPRYLAMVEEAMAHGRMFGMIQPDAMRPEEETGPALFRVGCLGRITSFAETEDGRIILSLLGLTRFVVEEELPLRLGFRRLRVDYEPYRADLTGVAEPLDLPREELLTSLEGYFARHQLSADWEAVNALEDEDLLTALCMMCPFEPSEKQALLEAGSLQERGRILQALLTFGLHAQDPESGTTRLS